MNEGAAPSSQVLAVLDDAAAGVVALALSSVLARALRRELAVVYVESTRSLGAAALPFAQVLSHPGLAWQPLRAADVEQGFRAQAARLRGIAEREARQHALHWSLQVRRGSLPDAAEALWARADLMVLAAASPLQGGFFGHVHPARRPPVVAALADASPAGQRALAVARQLAQALGGQLETARGDSGPLASVVARMMAAPAVPAVLVLPRAPLDAAALARLPCPLLLVD